jgi:hemerythrin
LRTSLGTRVDAYRRTTATGAQLSQFLYEWFLNHIQIEDRKIAAHILAAKSQQPSRQP